jgi:hypothetical protein
MSPPNWATPDQLEFLNARLSDFQAAQREKTTPTFWNVIYRDFFLRWADQNDEVWPVVEKKRKSAKSPPDCADMPLPKWIALRKNVCSSNCLLNLNCLTSRTLANSQLV